MQKILDLKTNSGHNCTGCSACMNICPKEAIKMIQDKEGFDYPNIDTNKCIACGKCDSVCPILSPIIPNNILPIGISWSHPNKIVKRRSSSGGVFYLVAEYVINQGGVVVGAGWDNEWLVEHQIAEKIEELYNLQESKYLQSKIGNIYLKIKEFLDKKRLVFFVGTSCQVAGLFKYLGEKRDDLITADLICHGVPSPKVWKKYLDYISNGKLVSSVCFRRKVPTWENLVLTITYQNAMRYQCSGDRDLYMKGFLNNIYLRPSCYECQYRGINRISDFTLSDFWGVKQMLPEAFDAEGTSFILLHTDLAQNLFNKLAPNAIKIEKYILAYNPSLVIPSNRHSLRDEFFEGLQKGENIYTLLNTYADKL